MDGTFFNSYEIKISSLEQLIEVTDDPILKKKYNDEITDYMIDCIPFLQKYSEPTKELYERDPIFGTLSKKGVKRHEIYKEYLHKVEGCVYHTNEKNEKKKFKIKNLTDCNKCNSVNTIIQDQRTHEDICKKCGACFQVLGEELGYKEEHEQQEKIIICGYKKENHLNEWILQFQGKENTNIPDDVVSRLRSEFKKQKIKSIKEISKEKVKQFLKKLGLTKYYEHATYITHTLNGITPPRITKELEDRLRLMFREIQEPFQKHCPPDRNNFLSYSYVLYKFCELLSEDNYLPFFPLLKAKDKLRQQDVIWEKICNEVHWEYIPTI